MTTAELFELDPLTPAQAATLAFWNAGGMIYDGRDERDTRNATATSADGRRFIVRPDGSLSASA